MENLDDLLKVDEKENEEWVVPRLVLMRMDITESALGINDDGSFGFSS